MLGRFVGAATAGVKALRLNVVSFLALGVSYGCFVALVSFEPFAEPLGKTNAALVAQALGVIPVTLVNYLMNIYWTWKKGGSGEAATKTVHGRILGAIAVRGDGMKFYGLATLFASCALVQLNDPDPGRLSAASNREHASVRISWPMRSLKHSVCCSISSESPLNL